jgi:hypothetical protein
MPVTRVFVMGLTAMLSEVVRTVVANHSTLLLVGESPVTDFDRAAASRPDIVVAPLDLLSDGDLTTFLQQHCRAGVLALARDASTAALYEMRPHRTPLGELGTEALATALDRSRGES